MAIPGPSWCLSASPSQNMPRPNTALLLTALLAIASVALQGCGNSGVSTMTTTTSVTTPGDKTITTTTTTPQVGPPPGDECLCIFDIDRTLTGKQGNTGACPKDQVQPGIKDDAYGGGMLTLSDFALHVDQTFCATCYLGTISAGSGGSPDGERRILHDKLSVGPGKAILENEWSGGCDTVTSPLVFGCQDGHKQKAVAGMIQWYGEHAKIGFKHSNVHFFDDRASNIAPFQTLDYNAHQISCASRDSSIQGVGLCGATVSEIVKDPGVKFCSKAAADAAGSPEELV